MLIHLDLSNSPWQRPWAGWHGMNYIKLAEGLDVQKFEAKIKRLPHEYIGEELKQKGIESTIFLQPITDIHLHSNLSWEAEPPGNPVYTYIFSGIGIFILPLPGTAVQNPYLKRNARKCCQGKDVYGFHQ